MRMKIEFANFSKASLTLILDFADVSKKSMSFSLAMVEIR